MSSSTDDTDRMAPSEQPDAVQLPPGTMVANRYLLAQVLGSGGEGLVYAGVDTHLGHGVAIKVSVYDDVESRARLRREALIGNLLGNDIQGVVRCLEWGELPERGLYIVQDIVDKAQPLNVTVGPLEARLQRLREAAELVALVHSRGVVHRDIKPANFLVDAKGSLFLTDFGLAKQIGEEQGEEGGEDDLTVKGRAMGTPSYMPLEQFQDARDVDYRADVYALGAMLYLALTGEPPFKGDSMKVLTQQVKANYEGRELRPSLVSESVPAELDALCVEALALDVGARLASAKEFLSRLGARSPERSPAAVPAARPTRRTPRPPRQKPEAEVVEFSLGGEPARAKVTGLVDERRRLARLEGQQRPLLLRGAEVPQLLELEAQHLAELSHPNVVPLLGRAQTRQGEVLVVEPTPPLPPALPLAVALDFGLDLLAGLAVLHEHGLAFPELKRECLGVAFSPVSLRLPPPAELVALSQSGEARLLLSELSGARSLATLASLAEGVADPGLPAPQFLHPLAAPEVVERLEGGAAPAADPRAADVYAAGHLLQDLLLKQAPYEGRAEPLHQLKREELAGRSPCDEAALQRLPETLGELLPLVRAMLSPTPSERPSVLAALDTLRRVAAASPLETPSGRLWRSGPYA